MRKPTYCIWENKDADQLHSNCEVTAKLISLFVFATWIVQSLFFLNPEVQYSSLLLCLYRPVCVRPVRKLQCWFSQDTAQLFNGRFQSSLCQNKFQFLVFYLNLKKTISENNFVKQHKIISPSEVPVFSLPIGPFFLDQKLLIFD